MTQLRAPRAATRLGPKEARILAQRARAAGLAPGSARALFELLLRVCDPQHGFTRQLPFETPKSGKTEGLLEQLGIARTTLKDAIRALRRSGLVIIEHGTGREWTRFTLDAAKILDLLGELPGSPWVTYPVNPGEFDGSEEVEIRPPAGRKTTPRGADFAPPYVRGRESDPVRPNSPLPRQAAAGPRVDGSPPASGRGPLSESERCKHGRKVSQGGCKRCKTNPRALADRQAADERAEQHRAHVADQLRQRAELAAAKASAPPPDPELIKAARAAAQAGKRAPK